MTRRRRYDDSDTAMVRRISNQWRPIIAGNGPHFIFPRTTNAVIDFPDSFADSFERSFDGGALANFRGAGTFEGRLASDRS